MPQIRVASWNIHKAVGTDRRRDLGRVSRVIAEIAPEIMALQETDIRVWRARSMLEREVLEEAGLRSVPLPEPCAPARGWRGNALLIAVHVRIEEVRLLSLPGFEVRGAIIADLRVQDTPLRVVATHMALDPVNRAHQARMIRDRLTTLPDQPTLFMGDTNEWRRGSGSLAAMVEHLPSAPTTLSFPAWRPLLPLDRVMLRGGEVRDFAVHRSALSRRASDHLPVKARLHI